MASISCECPLQRSGDRLIPPELAVVYKSFPGSSASYAAAISLLCVRRIDGPVLLPSLSGSMFSFFLQIQSSGSAPSLPPFYTLGSRHLEIPTVCLVFCSNFLGTEQISRFCVRLRVRLIGCSCHCAFLRYVLTDPSESLPRDLMPCAGHGSNSRDDRAAIAPPHALQDAPWTWRQGQASCTSRTC